MVELLFISYDGQFNQQNVPKTASRHTHSARQYYKQRDQRQRAAQRPRSLATLRPKPDNGESSHTSSSTPENEVQVPRQKYQDCKRLQYAGSSQQAAISPPSSLASSLIDPFDSMCLIPGARDPQVQESLNYFVSNQLMDFRTVDTKFASEALKKEVFGRAVWHPGIFQICIYGGMINKAYRTGVPLCPRYRYLALRYKQGAIAHVRQGVQGRSVENVPEETLAVMLRLAVHGSEISEVDAHEKQEEATYFSNAQNVDYYLRFETGWDHLRALYSIVDAKGGILSLKVEVFKHALQVFDVFCAWRSFQAPHFPLPEPVSAFIAQRHHQEDAQAQELLKELGSGFRPLLGGFPYDSSNHELHQQAAIVTADYDQVLRNQVQKPRDPKARPDEVMLKYTRWLILHDILCIPSPGIPESLTDLQLTQEASRYILLAFSFAVLVPLPPSRSTDLAERLTQEILCVVTELAARASPKALSSMHILRPDVSLCLAVWGGICAEVAEQKDPLQNAKLHSTAKTLLRNVRLAHPGLPRTWKEVSGVMRSFLWLDQVCEEKGRRVWESVMLEQTCHEATRVTV